MDANPAEGGPPTEGTRVNLQCVPRIFMFWFGSDFHVKGDKGFGCEQRLYWFYHGRAPRGQRRWRGVELFPIVGQNDHTGRDIEKKTVRAKHDGTPCLPSHS